LQKWFRQFFFLFFLVSRCPVHVVLVLNKVTQPTQKEIQPGPDEMNMSTFNHVSKQITANLERQQIIPPPASKEDIE